jgi:hypothetical protein
LKKVREELKQHGIVPGMDPEKIESPIETFDSLDYLN